MSKKCGAPDFFGVFLRIMMHKENKAIHPITLLKYLLIAVAFYPGICVSMA